MKNIKDYDLPALKEEFIQMGEKPFRAEQVFKWLYEAKAVSLLMNRTSWFNLS